MPSTTFFEILTIFMVLITPSAAWTLTVYPDNQDYSRDIYVMYDSNDASPQCFFAGRPGEDVTRQTAPDDGKTWSDCADDAPSSDPAKLSFTISKSNCCAWEAVGDGCAGSSLASDGECLQGSDDGGGNEIQFQCTNE